MKNTFRKYPNFAANGNPFQYSTSSDGITMTRVSRTEFLDLVHSVPHEDDHVYIDREAGMAIFFSDLASVGEALDFSRKDFNREAKRQQRAHQCVLKGTKGCDGWKPDENGFIRCDTCTRRHPARTISIDAPVSYDEDGEPVTLDFPSDEDATARLFAEADKAILHDALAALSEADREYLLARHQPGMTARQLAEDYGIDDFRYANRKAQRILGRVTKHIRESEK